MSSSSSEENYGTTSSSSQDNFSSSKCKPSTIGKQIDDYLNSKAIEKEERSQAEKPEENISCADGTEDEVVCFEQTMTRYLTQEEMLAFQLHDSSVNGAEWSGTPIPQLYDPSNTDGKATGNQSPPWKTPLEEELQTYQAQFFNSRQWGYPSWTFQASMPNKYSYPTENSDHCLSPQFAKQPKQLLETASMFPKPISFQQCQQSEFASLNNNALNKKFGDAYPLTTVEEFKMKSKDNEIFALRHKLHEVFKENESLKENLGKQKSQLDQLTPRLTFLEDHFEEFIVMKNDYLSLKEANRKNSERGNTTCKYAQTWATTVMCDFCVRTRDMLENPRFKHAIQLEENKTLHILQSDYDDLLKTFRFLRKEIRARECEYENRKEKAELIRLNELNLRNKTKIYELQTKNKQLIDWIQYLENIISKSFTEEKAA